MLYMTISIIYRNMYNLLDFLLSVILCDVVFYSSVILQSCSLFFKLIEGIALIRFASPLPDLCELSTLNSVLKGAASIKFIIIMININHQFKGQ